MKIYVWDRLVRLLHILMIVGVISAFTSYQMDMMTWHMYNGYAMLGVVALRIVWGFIGPENARFSSFIKHPRVVLNYIATWKTQKIGTTHNPLGGYAVLGLLGALLLQATTGLFSTDDILVYGPLYDSVSSKASSLLTDIHENGFYFIMLPMIALHITAIFVYWRFKKINLVGPMITGYKDED